MNRQTMKSAPGRARYGSVVAAALIALLSSGCGSEAADAETSGEAAVVASAGQVADGGPYVHATSPVEAGRYLVVVGGCNDCHTEGYLQTEGQVPEDQWLLGSRMGWRGPWGTTYSSNLRLTVQRISEDAWVEQMRTRHANPPMPWMNANQMSERDARAIYRYAQSLGAAGEPVPAMVPPGQEPKTPYISLFPQNLPEGAR